MKKISKAAVAALATAAATLGVLTSTSASAAVPTPQAGNITVLPAAPRLVPFPGIALANSTVTLQVTGAAGVPARATGVLIDITATDASSAGDLRVWTTGAGEPGTPTVQFTRGQQSTATTFVGLDDTGKLNVAATGTTRFVMSIKSFVTPAAVCKPTTSTIPASAAPIVLHNVGGTIVNAQAGKGATDAGSVHLAAGTYDMRVLGNFIGLNETTDSAFEGIQTFGTMVVWTGDTIAPDFSNVLATGGGVLIPKANSTTLTIDPTDGLSQFVTLSAEADVHVGFFAYDDNSGSVGTAGQPGAGAITALIQSAVFKSVC